MSHHDSTDLVRLMKEQYLPFAMPVPVNDKSSVTQI